MKLHVRATPNARSSEIVGWEEEAQVGRVLRVRIAAPPVDGKANAALREFLAKALGLSKSRVILEKGGSSRYKTFSIPDGTDFIFPDRRVGSSVGDARRGRSPG